MCFICPSDYFPYPFWEFCFFSFIYCFQRAQLLNAGKEISALRRLAALRIHSLTRGQRHHNCWLVLTFSWSFCFQAPFTTLAKKRLLREEYFINISKGIKVTFCSIDMFSCILSAPPLPAFYKDQTQLRKKTIKNVTVSVYMYFKKHSYVKEQLT